MADWLLDHDTTRPVRMLPDASRSSAVSCEVCPIGTEVVAGNTVTVATGTAMTLTFVQPRTPSMLAKTTVLPTLMPVTTPELETSAMLAALLEIGRASCRERV